MQKLAVKERASGPGVDAAIVADYRKGGVRRVAAEHGVSLLCASAAIHRDAAEMCRRARPRMQERRRELRLSLRQLADRVGSGRSFIGNVERGENRARVELAQKIADELALPVDDLFGDPELLIANAADIEARRGRVERDYKLGLSTTKLAKREGVSAVTISNDLAFRGVEARPFSRRPYGEELRGELFANAGACGSPTCTDPDCTFAAGACHQCGEAAATASRTLRGRRLVKGHPTLLCSDPKCAQRANYAGAVARWRDGFRAYKEAQGLHDLQEAAAKVDRDINVVRRKALKLRVGERYRLLSSPPHDGAWLFTGSDIAAIAASLQADPRSLWMKRSWDDGVGPARKLIELAGGAARRRWKNRWTPRPGRPLEYTKLQARAVRALKAEDESLGYRRLAKRTNLTVSKVRGILKA